MTRLISIAIVLLMPFPCFGEARTENFVVNGPHESDVAKTAEYYREYLAVRWFGEAFPTWNQPASVTVAIGTGAGGGLTEMVPETALFHGTWQGDRKPLLEDVVPHEVMHMLLATRFKKPLPRFIDEGIASLVESRAVGDKYRAGIIASVQRGQDVPIGRLVSLAEYPPSIFPFYCKSYSLMEFLRWHDTRERLISTIQTTLDSGWSVALREHYGYESNDELGIAWMNWLRRKQEYPRHVVASGQLQYGSNGWTSSST